MSLESYRLVKSCAVGLERVVKGWEKGLRGIPASAHLGAD